MKSLSKSIVILLLLLLLLLYNLIIIIFASQTIGIRKANGRAFYTLKETSHETLYKWKKELIRIIPKDDENNFTIIFENENDKMTLLSQVQKDFEQYTIHLYTTDNIELWRGVYHKEWDKQITSISQIKPENNIDVGSSTIYIKNEWLSVMFKNGEYIEIPLKDLSKIITKNTTYKLEGQIKDLVYGLFVQVIGICIILFRNNLFKVERWLAGFFFQNTDNLKPTDLYLFCVFILGTIFILLGLVFVSIICI